MADGHNRGAKNQIISFGDSADRPQERDQRSPDLTVDYAGLCASCERRETCDKPKVPGGIWSCHDYSEL